MQRASTRSRCLFEGTLACSALPASLAAVAGRYAGNTGRVSHVMPYNRGLQPNARHCRPEGETLRGTRLGAKVA